MQTPPTRSATADDSRHRALTPAALSPNDAGCRAVADDGQVFAGAQD
ncbi:hypothetical protein AB0B66_43320 [Catellatospora sp. NPDC049111]